MGPRRTRAKDLRRKTATRPERKTVVVFCEGEASEPEYINALKRQPGVRDNTAISVEVVVDPGVPRTLARWAIDRSRDDEVDECWCVFDVEWPQNHPNLKEAVSLAKDHGIRLAISNPCFELWLILHRECPTGFMNTCDAERRSRELDGRTGKRIDAHAYMPLRSKASAHAAKLTQRHERNGTLFPQDNPSSSMLRPAGSHRAGRRSRHLTLLRYRLSRVPRRRPRGTRSAVTGLTPGR
jgi:hypothetical protein